MKRSPARSHSRLKVQWRQRRAPLRAAATRRDIHGLIDQYLEDAQARNKKPLRNGTADTRQYILKKLVVDSGISTVGDVTGAKDQPMVGQLKQPGSPRTRDGLMASGYAAL